MRGLQEQGAIGMTPMMEQYLSVKSEYPDAILFYRLGDFYEMFFDDAKTVSREIGLTLTGRDCGEKERAPMCGVPYHSADTYISKLVKLGHKIVICEQTEDPAHATGLVKREITRIVTPGTVTEDTMLVDDRNNYIASICFDDGETGVTFADVSTGDICTTRLSGEGLSEKLLNEMAVYSPAEVIMNVPKRSDRALFDYFFSRPECMVTDNAAERFELSFSEQLIVAQFGSAPASLGLYFPTQVRSVGALLDYMKENQRTASSYFKTVKVYSDKQYLDIDINTRRSLELTETMRTGETRGSLLWAIDRTKSAMGARMLRKWIEQPLVDADAINARLDAVESLYENMIVRSEISEIMREVRDMERLMSRVIYGTSGCKDLRAICSTLSLIPRIKELIGDSSAGMLASLCNELGDTSDIVERIDTEIVDDPPFSVREGRFIRQGYNEDVDRLVNMLDHGKEYLDSIEQKEREETGIPKLKIGYNKVFGYYIEVSKSYTDSVPERYIRKQTLVNCERYITDELKELEATILGAADRDGKLEYELYCELAGFVADNRERISQAAFALAKLDALCSLAESAFRNNYVRPYVDTGDVIDIKDGRHPVVEAFSRDSYFVPNDTYLDTGDNRLALITGPNMAGKSTYMRQTAVICILAQAGSFVPAASAHIGIVDKLFTRVGASDDLASGRSTFMIEMNEVAYILKNATCRSLVIYDEIGRGTSTFDGMSIARAVAEYTAEKLKCKTLFATHYHELTDMESQTDGVVNYNIAARKKNGEIIFLRKIVRGAADDSYGIDVAKLAGVPAKVIDRAREILGSIENGERTPVHLSRSQTEENVIENMSIDDISMQEIKEKLRDLSVDTLTPIEAMNFLYEIKKMLD